MNTNSLSHINKENIKSLSHLPIHIACLSLNTELETLKKRCRELGLKRWPYNARKEMKRYEMVNKKENNKLKGGCFQIHSHNLRIYPIQFPKVNAPKVKVVRKRTSSFVEPLPKFSDLLETLNIKTK